MVLVAKIRYEGPPKFVSNQMVHNERSLTKLFLAKNRMRPPTSSHWCPTEDSAAIAPTQSAPFYIGSYPLRLSAGMLRSLPLTFGTIQYAQT